MRTILAVHILNPENIGDAMCCPLDYVSLDGFNIQKVDINRYSGGDAIIGGGGLLHPASDERLRAATEKDAIHVLWGVGTNYHGETAPIHPEWLSKYDLVGLRDFCPSNTNPVPCASCLSGEFDKVRTPSYDAVIYEHHANPVVTVIDDLPRLNNRGSSQEHFGRVLDFIGSGRTVITSSYHGAYWAMLMGRTPIISEPFSNRFLFFETPLPVMTKTDNNWMEKAKAFSPVPTYLDRCRQLNLAFADKVKEVFK